MSQAASELPGTSLPLRLRLSCSLWLEWPLSPEAQLTSGLRPCEGLFVSLLLEPLKWHIFCSASVSGLH